MIIVGGNAKMMKGKEERILAIGYIATFGTYLEQFLEFILYILYTVSKLRKSGVQRFKRCVNQSWNEVMAIGSKSHQVERQFRKLQNHKVLAAKSAFLCEMETFSLQNFVAHVACCEIHLSASRYLQPTLLDFFFRYLLFKSPFSPCNPPIIGFLS